jgi:hypothetical protein
MQVTRLARASLHDGSMSIDSVMHVGRHRGPCRSTSWCMSANIEVHVGRHQGARQPTLGSMSVAIGGGRRPTSGSMTIFIVVHVSRHWGPCRSSSWCTSADIGVHVDRHDGACGATCWRQPADPLRRGTARWRHAPDKKGYQVWNIHAGIALACGAQLLIPLRHGTFLQE